MQQMVLYVLSRFSQRLLRRCVLKDRNLMQLIILLDNQEDSELTLDFFFIIMSDDEEYNDCS